MPITTCAVTGNVKNLLGTNVQNCVVRAHVVAPFFHTGSFISGEIASTTTSASGDFSLTLIETETVARKISITFEYYDGVSARKQKSFAVVIPDEATAELSDLVSISELVGSAVSTFPASNVTVSAISGLSATQAQAAFAEHQADITALEAADSALDTRLDNVETDISNIESDVTAAQADATQALSDAADAQAAADAAQADATQALSDASDAQTDIDNHIADATAAHAATAVSVTPAGAIASTTVQAALEEIQTDATQGISDAAAAQADATQALSDASDAQDDIDEHKLESGPHGFLEQGSTPATPSANHRILYPKDDGQFYHMGSDGIEVPVGSGSGGSDLVVDRFEGDGVETDFTLSEDPGDEANTFVYISGVYQQKDTYSITGTTLSFSTAPPADGVTPENIEVVIGGRGPQGPAGPAGTGDVDGPASAVDNRIARFDGTTGKLIQNSGASIDDSGNISANNLSGTNTGDQDLSDYFDKTADDLDDIDPGTTNVHFTAAYETKLSGIEALADVTDAANVGAVNHAASSKATPIDADTFPITDTAASNVIKKVSFTNLKAFLKTYFDTLYQAVGSYITASSTDTLTNKTIDANGTGNSISNLEVADLASGVLDTDLSSVSGSDDTIPSAKATKTALDGKQPLDGTLTALAAYNTNGLIAQTAADTFAGRTLTASTGISVSNGNGVSGNPTVAISSSMLDSAIEFVIDGGGSVITTGTKGQLEIPFGCTINRWTILADQSGSIVIDVWKDTYANAPPTVADTITASAKPTLTTAQAAQSSTLTGWTTSITAGDIIRFNVDSASTVTRVTISLKVTRA